jgi:hypothetical protein
VKTNLRSLGIIDNDAPLFFFCVLKRVNASPKEKKNIAAITEPSRRKGIIY